MARWCLRSCLATGVTLDELLDAAWAVRRADRSLTWELVRFGAASYAIYPATFDRPLPPERAQAR